MFKGKKVDVGRFKGLGEMNPNQLKETTMDPETRTMLRVTLPKEYEERHKVKDLVDRRMGKHTEHRLQFIQSNADTLDEAAIDDCRKIYALPTENRRPPDYKGMGQTRQ